MLGQLAFLGRRRNIGQVWQDGSAWIAAGRRATSGVDDRAVLVDEYQIAASTHRFYNEQHSIVLAGRVALVEVQLEHTLQPRLAKDAKASAAQVLADDEREWGVALQAADGKVLQTLHTSKLGVSGEEHAAAASAWREELGSQAELVDEGESLQSAVLEQMLQLVANGRQRQRVEAHPAG